MGRRGVFGGWGVFRRGRRRRGRRFWGGRTHGEPKSTRCKITWLCREPLGVVRVGEAAAVVIRAAWYSAVLGAAGASIVLVVLFEVGERMQALTKQVNVNISFQRDGAAPYSGAYRGEGRTRHRRDLNHGLFMMTSGL